MGLQGRWPNPKNPSPWDVGNTDPGWSAWHEGWCRPQENENQRWQPVECQLQLFSCSSASSSWARHAIGTIPPEARLQPMWPMGWWADPSQSSALHFGEANRSRRFLSTFFLSVEKNCVRPLSLLPRSAGRHEAFDDHHFRHPRSFLQRSPATAAAESGSCCPGVLPWLHFPG